MVFLCVYLFNGSCVVFIFFPSFIYSSICLYVSFLACLFVCHFVGSFARLFIRSFIRCSFVYSLFFVCLSFPSYERLCVFLYFLFAFFSLVCLFAGSFSYLLLCAFARSFVFCLIVLSFIRSFIVYSLFFVLRQCFRFFVGLSFFLFFISYKRPCFRALFFSCLFSRLFVCSLIRFFICSVLFSPFVRSQKNTTSLSWRIPTKLNLWVDGTRNNL